MDLQKRVRSVLRSHPRLTSAVFTALLLLSQVGAAVAGNGGATTGP